MQAETIKPICQATYRNGRWGNNTASVFEAEGHAYFSNGFSDPIQYDNRIEAEGAFRSFIADLIPGDCRGQL